MKIIIRHIVLCLLVTLPFINGIASGRTYLKYTISDGLTNNSIKIIFEDDHGFVWVGTENGIARFTGREFIPLEPYNSSQLEKAFVNDITQDDAGRIWIGTIGRGLLVYDVYRNSMKQYREIDGKNLSNIREFLNYDNKIHVLTFDNEVVVFEDNNLSYSYELKEAYNDHTAFIERNGSPIILSSGGNIFKYRNGIFYLDSSVGLDKGFRLSVFENISGNNILASGSDGIIREIDLSKNKIEKEFKDFKGFPIKDIKHNYKKNETYISVRGKGLFSFQNGYF